MIATELEKIYAIALNTFRETVRDRIIYSLLVFIVLVTFIAILLGSLSIGQNEKILRDFGLASIAFIGGIISIFAGTNLVFKEIDKRTIYIIFTKPLTGWQFILGKYCGLSFCLLMLLISMGLFLTTVLSFSQGDAFWHQLQVLALPLATVYLEILFVIGLAIFFSTFSTPVMSVLFTLSLWLIGHFGDSLKELGKISQNESLGSFMNFVYWLLPDLASLTRIRGMIAAGNNASNEALCYLTCYVVAYVLILLVLASVITERREFI